ncbi:hypothetical protein BV25DRAFT_1815200, partial [Artomyces pyxidatus]
FRARWIQGVPIVVEGLLDHLMGRWKPQDLILRYGDTKITLVNVVTNATKASTVRDFFDGFGRHHELDQIWKLKDWPPTELFQAKFGPLYAAFQRAIPFPDLVRLDGVLNLRSHFPDNGVVPDLGPKMYNAYGPGNGGRLVCSTRLHMDMTDACNMMAHSEPFNNRETGTARWHIFPWGSIPILREFLRTTVNFSGAGDPIHSQSIYLDDSLLDLLASQHNVRPYTIDQRPGDVVYIPAGCPHQVRNETSAFDST